MMRNKTRILLLSVLFNTVVEVPARASRQGKEIKVSRLEKKLNYLY
jgi:hypothetical protein